MSVRRRPCSKCGRNRAEKFFRGPRGRVCLPCQRNRSRKASRSKRLIETYGLTHAEYDLLFKAQGGACAICKGKRSRNLDVDHDHKMAETHGMRASIRGLLCARCNRGLLARGSSNPTVLRAAADYIESPPAQGLLA